MTKMTKMIQQKVKSRPIKFCTSTAVDKEKIEEGNFRNNGKFASTIDANGENVENEKVSMCLEQTKRMIRNVDFFNDNAGCNGEN